MLCRYDTMALKALDIFSVHGFPVGLVQCESNFTGIVNGTGTNVGSGGWTNIVDKYVKAKRYCESPYEVRRNGSRNVKILVVGERIGEMHQGRRRRISIRCRSATEDELAPRSLDAVFTDPPYFGNVQYGELMDFCYVWLRRLAGSDAEGFDRPSTRSPQELTGNVTQERGLEHFTEGLSHRLYAYGPSPEVGCAAGVHIPSQQARRLLRGRRRNPGRRSGVLGVAALSGGDGRLDSHSRYELVDHRHRLRVPELRRHAGELAVRHTRAARRDRGRGLGASGEHRQNADLWRHAMHRPRSSDADGGLGTPRCLEPLEFDGGEAGECS